MVLLAEGELVHEVLELLLLLGYEMPVSVAGIVFFGIVLLAQDHVVHCVPQLHFVLVLLFAFTVN